MAGPSRRNLAGQRRWQPARALDKAASLATGTAEDFQGTIDGSVIPAHTQLQSGVGMPAGSDSPYQAVTFETLEDITTSAGSLVEGTIRALDPGSFGNLPDGSGLTPQSADQRRQPRPRFAYDLTGGTDDETDDQLRARASCSVFRIRRWAVSQADYAA